VIASELLKRAEDLLDQDVQTHGHRPRLPERCRQGTEILDDIAIDVNPTTW
jgi:hypothetical protein